MSENVQNILPYITGVFFLLALLLLVLSLRWFRRSRTDVFWRRRRDAGQRGWRTFVLSAVLIILGTVSCVFTVFSALMNDDEPTPAPTEILTGQSPTPLPDAAHARPDRYPGCLHRPKPRRHVIVIVTATPGSTPTETSFPTFTPIVTPLVSDVTPLPDAAIRITALDDQISDSLTPVNPRAAFPAGSTRIYLFVEFTGMAQGVLWKRELYREGELIDGSSYLWGLEIEGTSYFFFGNDSGFAPGEYEIRLYIGDDPDPVNIASFAIVEVP